MRYLLYRLDFALWALKDRVQAAWRRLRGIPEPHAHVDAAEFLAASLELAAIFTILRSPSAAKMLAAAGEGFARALSVTLAPAADVPAGTAALSRDPSADGSPAPSSPTAPDAARSAADHEPARSAGAPDRP